MKFTIPKALPKFNLTDEEGKELCTVSVVDIVKAAGSAPTVQNPNGPPGDEIVDAGKQVETVQLFLSRKAGIEISEDVALILIEQSMTLYEEQKKSCMGTPESEDSDSIQTA